MSLRYALLALLTAQSMTGYDVAKAFHSSVGHVWHAPDSQIYPELRKMEQSGLIRGTAVAWGPRGSKTEYAITPEGITAFRTWMAEPMEYSRDRDPAHLRAAYLEWTDEEHARAQLTAHREHFTEQLHQWQGQLRAIQDHTHPIVARRLEIFPASEWERIVAFKAFAYEGLVERAESEIAWANRGLRLLEKLRAN